MLWYFIKTTSIVVYCLLMVLGCSSASTSNKVSVPTGSIQSGQYFNPFLLELKCSTQGATIYWKHKEKSEWLQYVEPIPIVYSSNLEIYAAKKGMAASDNIEFTYNLTVSKKGIFENHSVAMTSFSIYSGVFVDVLDIGKVFYGVTRSGQYARLFRYNMAKGKVDFVEDIYDAKGAWGITYYDNNLYIGTYLNANLYKFNVIQNKLDKILQLTDATHVWDIKLRDGCLYIGTYPNAIIYKYDLVTSTYTKYQGFTPNNYIRSIEEHNGKIYAGVGPKAQLIEYDLATNAYKDILPQEYKNESFVYDLKILGDKLFIGLSPSYDILEYDLSSGVIRTLMQNANVSNNVVVPTFNANHLQFQLIEILFEYDLSNKSLNRVLSSKPENTALVGAYADPVGKVIGVLPEGIYREYSFSGQILNSVDFLTSGITGLPDYPMSIAAFDNKVYLAGKRLRVYNPITKTESYSLIMGEAKSMSFLGGSLATANYAAGTIWYYPVNVVQNIAEYDLINERYKLATIGYSQTRPRKIVADFSSRSLLVGTEPGYGQYGGALTYYNTITNQSYTERNIVNDHTVFDVIYDSNHTKFAYIGTSVYGGTTIPLAEDAHIVKWDIENRQIIFDKIPEINNGYIISIVHANDKVYIVTSNKNLYIIDSNAGNTLAIRTNSGIFKIIKSIDGLLYGVSNTSLFIIDKEDLGLKMAKDGFSSITNITEDIIGNRLYIVDGYNLFSYR